MLNIKSAKTWKSFFEKYYYTKYYKPNISDAKSFYKLVNAENPYIYDDDEDEELSNEQLFELFNSNHEIFVDAYRTSYGDNEVCIHDKTKNKKYYFGGF